MRGALLGGSKPSWVDREQTHQRLRHRRPRCANCGGAHNKTECNKPMVDPSKRICFKCGKERHRAAQCLARIRSVRRLSGPFWLPTRDERRETKALRPSCWATSLRLGTNLRRCFETNRRTRHATMVLPIAQMDSTRYGSSAAAYWLQPQASTTRNAHGCSKT